MKKVMLLVAVLFLVALAGSATAKVAPWGLIQTWYSYAAYDAAELGTVATDYEASTQTGFGIKRGFLGLKWKDEDLSGSIFYNAVAGTDKAAVVVDAWLAYQVNEQLKVTAGRQTGVCLQVQKDSSAKLDLIQRPLLALNWVPGTDRVAGRSIGVNFDYKINDQFSAALFLHNGDGQQNLLPSSGSTNDVADTGALPQIDLGFVAKPMDELKCGVTYGLPNEDRLRVGNMTAFGYYDNGEFFGKLDFAMLMHKPAMGEKAEDLDLIVADSSEGDYEYTGMGYSLTGGYYVNDNWALIGRFDQWDSDTDLDVDTTEFSDVWTTPTSGEGTIDVPFVYGNQHAYTYKRNLTLGASYTFNPDAKWDQRLLINFVHKMDEVPDDVSVPDPNMIQIMWQVFLH